ncbi:phospholipase D family protein [Escherichia coli]
MLIAENNNSIASKRGYFSLPAPQAARSTLKSCKSKFYALSAFLFFSFNINCTNAEAIDVGFSSEGTALPLIIREIDSANEEILVAAYSFTSKPVSLALVKAKKRGVNVLVVADSKANQDRYTAVNYLNNHGVMVYLNDSFAIMHNKFMVFDEKTVQTGSFNYTSSAVNRNAENVIVIKDNKDVAKKFKQQFCKLWQK